MLQPPAFSTKGDHLNLHRQIFVTNHVDPHLMVAIEEEKKFLSHKNKQFFVWPSTEEDCHGRWSQPSAVGGDPHYSWAGERFGTEETLEFHRSRRKSMISVSNETPKWKYVQRKTGTGKTNLKPKLKLPSWYIGVPTASDKRYHCLDVLVKTRKSYLNKKFAAISSLCISGICSKRHFST